MNQGKKMSKDERWILYVHESVEKALSDQKQKMDLQLDALKSVENDIESFDYNGGISNATRSKVQAAIKKAKS